jgi:peptidoglycan/xylan/chitin deacetylase (PgdA/CDA1 family)
VTSPSDALRGALAFLLLPLSLVPLYFAVPRLRGEVARAAPDRVPFDAPDVKPSEAQLERWRPLPPSAAAVPVLAYHGINGHPDHYSVTRRQFAEQMAMLRRAGFETIGIAQYARFLQGITDGMPKRPILITFDDGRLDSYRGADRILAEYGFKATMFVIAGYVEEHSSFYLTWDELRTMTRGGRWDVQEHAGVGHVNVAYDAHGHKAPAYANRQYVEGKGLESFEEFKSRVRHDILWGKRTMSEQLPGFTPWSFAVPFGDYGNRDSNDPRIKDFMGRFLRKHFQAVFMTEPPEYTTPASDRWRLGRIEIHSDTPTDHLYRWLRDGTPRPAAPIKSGARNDNRRAPSRRAVKVNASKVRVAVLNGTEVKGVAAKVGKKVRARGFRLGTVADAARSDQKTSVVLYRRGQKRAAQTVADRFGMGKAKPVDSASKRIARSFDVVILAGRDRSR